MSKIHYGAFLKEVRKKNTLKQDEVANTLGISRASYINIESGKRNPSFEEVQKLAVLFNVAVDDLIPGMQGYQKKYEQMLAYIVRIVGHKKKLTKTKLAKMLYLADFVWFYNNQKSMSGLQYRKIQYGPVPDYFFRLFDSLAEDGKISVRELSGGALITKETEATKLIPDDLLSDKERETLTLVASKWISKTTSEIKAFTHAQIPYKFADYGEIIPYGLITQEDPKHVY